MTTRDYIELITSDGMVTKKFTVLFEDYAEEDDKAFTEERTIGGHIDLSLGAIYSAHYWTLKVPHTVDDNSWGTLEDLLYFYRLNDPAGTPSNVITLRDHYYDAVENPVEQQIFFLGKLRRRSLSVIIDGTDSWFVTPVYFRVVPQ